MVHIQDIQYKLLEKNHNNSFYKYTYGGLHNIVYVRNIYTGVSLSLKHLDDVYGKFAGVRYAHLIH